MRLSIGQGTYHRLASGQNEPVEALVEACLDRQVSGKLVACC